MNLQSLDPANPFCMFEVSKVCATCTNHLLQGRSYSLDTIVDEIANVNLHHVLDSQFQFKCKENVQSSLCRQCFSKMLLLYDFHLQCTESAILFNKYVEYQEQLATLDTDLHMSDSHANSTDIDEEQEQKLTIEEEVIYTRDDSTMVKTEDECKVLDEQNSFDTNMSCNNIASDCQLIPPVPECSQTYNKTKPQIEKSSRFTEKKNVNDMEFTDSQGEDKEYQQITKERNEPKKKKQFRCTLCDAVFDKHGPYLCHKNIHERRFVCSFCGKAAENLFKLRIHERSHTGERPFECRLCGQAFTANSTLQRHLETHTTEKPFKCGVCKKMLKSRTSIYNHKLKHRGIR